MPSNMLFFVFWIDQCNVVIGFNLSNYYVIFKLAVILLIFSLFMDDYLKYFYTQFYWIIYNIKNMLCDK